MTYRVCCVFAWTENYEHPSGREDDVVVVKKVKLNKIFEAPNQKKAELLAKRIRAEFKSKLPKAWQGRHSWGSRPRLVSSSFWKLLPL